MQRVKIAEYLAILMPEDENIRYTEEARTLWIESRSLVYVDGKPIVGNYAYQPSGSVFAMGSNAWWNLVLASGKANLAKSDKLPSASLLAKSRARIIPCWQMASERESTVFEAEIRRDFLGKASLANWESVIKCQKMALIVT